MEAKIISLNSGEPSMMEWQGRSVLSSMLRRPVPGPLVVHLDRVEGNSFASPQFHGLESGVLYAYGVKSALTFLHLLGLPTFVPGAVGEVVTVDDLDETQVSVGDIFQFGEVRAQATYPRIPCAKVNIRMQHAQGQKAMQDCGRSGIYFRVLKPGRIYMTDSVQRVELAQHRFMIADVYRNAVGSAPLPREKLELAIKNGAFPLKALEKFKARLTEC